MPNTILIVEDDPNLLHTLQYNLNQEGYATLTATDGEAGLRMASRMSPDLVILDVMLPGLDGFEACRILRRQSEAPVIMLTARARKLTVFEGWNTPTTM